MRYAVLQNPVFARTLRQPLSQKALVYSGILAGLAFMRNGVLHLAKEELKREDLMLLKRY